MSAGEVLLAQPVAEPLVYLGAGEHDMPLVGCFGHRGGAGEVPARLGVGVAVGVVAEFGEHPGADHDAERGLGSDQLSGRVLAKRSFLLCLRLCDRGDRGGEHTDQREDGGAERFGDQRRLL